MCSNEWRKQESIDILQFHAEGQVFYNDYGEAFDGFNEPGTITRGQARQFFEDLLRRKTKDLFQINQEDRNRGLDATIG